MSEYMFEEEDEAPESVLAMFRRGASVEEMKGALSELDEQAMWALASELKACEPDEIRPILRLLADSFNGDRMAAITSMYSDPRVEVRNMALQAAIDTGGDYDTGCHRYFASLLLTDPDLETRLKAACLLGMFHTEENEAALRKALEDPHLPELLRKSVESRLQYF